MKVKINAKKNVETSGDNCKDPCRVLEMKVNMNAKKIGDMIVKIQYPCQAWARGEWKHQCRDKCKDPCQGESKEKDECKEKCGYVRYNFFRQKFILLRS